MSYRVLMVCTGNICRSVMAEEILREAVEQRGLDVVVDSAGISDEEHGHGIDSRAARALREGGYRVPSHRARQVKVGELQRWNLVLHTFAPSKGLQADLIRRFACSVNSRWTKENSVAGATSMFPTPGTEIILILRPLVRPLRTALQPSLSTS